MGLDPPQHVVVVVKCNESSSLSPPWSTANHISNYTLYVSVVRINQVINLPSYNSDSTRVRRVICTHMLTPNCGLEDNQFILIVHNCISWIIISRQLSEQESVYNNRTRVPGTTVTNQITLHHPQTSVIAHAHSLLDLIKLLEMFMYYGVSQNNSQSRYQLQNKSIPSTVPVSTIWTQSIDTTYV